MLDSIKIVKIWINFCKVIWKVKNWIFLKENCILIGIVIYIVIILINKVKIINYIVQSAIILIVLIKNKSIIINYKISS